MESKAVNNKILWVLTGSLMLITIVVILFKAWPILFPELIVKLPADPDCDLRAGPCVTQMNDGSQVSFSIVPRELPLMKPLQLQVEVDGLQANRIEVDFSGTDMHMGFNRFTLQPLSNDIFKGEGMLPVCVWDAMEWEAQVFIEVDRGTISVPYRFITVRQGMPLLGADP